MPAIAYYEGLRSNRQLPKTALVESMRKLLIVQLLPSKLGSRHTSQTRLALWPTKMRSGPRSSCCPRCPALQGVEGEDGGRGDGDFDADELLRVHGAPRSEF